LELSRQGRRRTAIGEPYEALDEAAAAIAGLDSTGKPRRGVAFNVTPGWEPDAPNLFDGAVSLEGTLLEFCNRRCDGLEICTGGAFGIVLDNDDTLYKFDDISNLKTQVALVNEGKNPLREGQLGRARVVAVLKDSSLIVRDITF